MKQMLCTFGLVLILTSLISSSALADIAGDWQKMDQLLDESGHYQSFTTFEKDPKEFVEGWLKFKTSYEKQLKTFTDEYGTEQQTITERFKDVEKPADDVRHSSQLISELLNYDPQRQTATILEWTQRNAEQSYRGWESMKNPSDEKFELKLKRAEQALTYYNLAAKLDPDGGFKKMIEKSEQAVDETRPQVKKALESKTWPTPNPDYNGPGNVDKLASAALDYLKKNPDWTKPVYDDTHEPYAAVVTGSGWEVYKEAPLTRDPLQYSINILVAFTGEKDKDIAYVYHMVFYTAEEKGVKKGLPFKFANARQYAQYRMLRKNVKTNSGSGSGGFGLFRLLTGILLIAGGMVSARTLLESRLTQLKPVIALLENLALPIGAVLVILGAGGFLCNLLRLAPLASILPQTVACLIGLLFVRKSLNIGVMQKLAFLDTFELPLGLGSLCLGILHIIIGGMRLF